MTAKLIFQPQTMPLEPDPHDFRYRLWLVVNQYADIDNPSDRLFVKHIHAIAIAPFDSPSFHRARAAFYLYVSKIHYGADKDFRGNKIYAKWARDFIEESKPLVLAKAIAQMWELPPKGFNPTGESLVGCWRNWVNKKLRLYYGLFDAFKKIKLDVSADEIEEKTGQPLHINDLDAQIAADQCRVKKQRKNANPPNQLLLLCLICQLHLYYELIDEYQKIELDVSADPIKEETGQHLHINDRAQIAADQYQVKKQREQAFLAFAEDVERADFWVTNHLINDPRCNYRMLAKRLLIGTDKIQAVADEFKCKYPKLNGQITRTFYPKASLRRLEKNLFASADLEIVKEAIANDSSLDKPVIPRYPHVTPKFMAKQRLPIFRPKSLTFEEIVKTLQQQDYLRYCQLDELKLESLWLDKCYPRIGKVVAEVLDYGIKSDL